MTFFRNLVAFTYLILLPGLMAAGIDLTLENARGQELARNDEGEYVTQPGRVVSLVVRAEKVDDEPELLPSGGIEIKGKNHISHSNIINGVHSTYDLYTYQFRISHQGRYEVGRVKCGDEKYGPLILNVEPLKFDSQTQELVYACQNGDIAVSYIRLEKETAFIGQPVTLIVDEYLLQNYVEKYDQPLNILHADEERLSREVKRIDFGVGEALHVKTRYKLTPHHEGGLTIGPLELAYKVSSQMGLGLFGKSFVQELRKVPTNSAHLEVKPLPQTDEEVDGIGHFTRYDLSLSKNQIKQQGFVTLKVELYGDALFEQVPHPPLVLPECFRLYPGASEDIVERGSVVGRRYLYELHLPQAGTFVIDPQSFYFFDYSDEDYHEITSKSQTLEVVGEVASEEQVEELDGEDISDCAEQEPSKLTTDYDVQLSLYEKIFFYPWSIRWPLFYLLALMLIIYGFWWDDLVRMWYALVLSRYTAYWVARLRLYRMTFHNKSLSVRDGYLILSKYIAQKCYAGSMVVCSIDQIGRALHKQGALRDRVDEARVLEKEFWSLVQAAFGDAHHREKSFHMDDKKLLELLVRLEHFFLSKG